MNIGVMNYLFEKILQIANFLWGMPLLLAILLIGLYFCIKLHFISICKVTELFKKPKKKSIVEGEIPLFQCLAIAMSGTIGSGNIVGVATAIAIGGPGTLFWIWVVSFICMILKMVEVTMAVAYRIRDNDSKFWGGPMFYINNGIKGWVGLILGKIYAIALLILVIADACFIQVNTFTTTLSEVLGIPVIVSGVLWIFAGIIILKIGKIRKIGRVCEIISPVMCITYIIGTIIIIFYNFNNIQLILKDIFKYAFRPAPAIGAFSGATLKTTISRGFSRGIFSNEAGQGTSTTIYAKAQNDHPIKVGLCSMIEVIADSFICTLTAFSILATASWKQELDGISLNLEAFNSTFGVRGDFIICITIAFFTFSSYISFFIEYCTCLKYLFSEKMIELVSWFYFIPPIIAITLPVYIIWSLADIAVGFIIIPNLIALYILRENFFSLWKDYNKK